MLSTTSRRHIFLAKQRLIHRDDVRTYRSMRALDEVDPEKLAQLQQERVLSLVQHAFATTPFYRDRYAAAGLSARDLTDHEVLAALPVIDRSDVRDQFERLRSRTARDGDFVTKTTGGSTGEPLRILHDRRASELALVWRMREWWGIHPGDPMAKVWRALRPNKSWGRTRRVMSWPATRIKLDAARMGEAEILRFLDEWDAVRPRLLIGYVGALSELARFVLGSGRRLAPVAAVEATAAPVTATDRLLLSEAFGGPVYDVYQSTEAPVTAAECAERDGLHVFSDTRWLELLDDAGRPVPPGETGTTVVTDLLNRAFPLIRYRQSDRTSWKPDGCRCSRPYPVLNPVRGRLTDDLYLPSGRTVVGLVLTVLFESSPRAIRQYQVVQHADRSLTLRYVQGDDPDAEVIVQRAAATLSERVRREVPVRLERVEVIPHDRGKSRLVLREDGVVPVPKQAGKSSHPARTNPLPPP